MEKGTLEKIVFLFLKHGYKSLTVDDIAKQLNISKKTIYQHYRSKKQIIIASFDYLLNDFYYNYYKKVNQEADDPISAIIKYRRFVLSHQDINEGRTRIKELREYYPTIYQVIIEKCTDYSEKLYTEFINEGKSAGFVKKSIDTKAAVYLYVSYIFDLRTSQRKYNPQKLLKMNDDIFDAFLDSIATEAGRKIIQNYHDNSSDDK